MRSQNILNAEPRVKPIVNTKGDTLIQLKVSDAKILLSDVLQKEVCDSTVIEYIKLDKTRLERISLLDNKILTTETKLGNTEIMLKNSETIVKNKDTEINLMKDTIRKQEKEISKQKFLKIFGFSSAIIIPVLAILFIK